MDVQKNPTRRFKLVLCFISILPALAITFFGRSFLTPYQLELIDHNSDFSYVVYHDFDKNGISEKLEGGNEPSEDSYRTSVLNNSGSYVDECHYVEPTRFNFATPWLVFGDYNDDEFDEIFAFTQAGDSLFLYMHDLRRKQVVIKRQFLLKNQFPIEYPGRSFVVIPGGLIDLTKSGHKALVFAAWSLASLQPRGVYIYDVQEQMIISRLENYVAWGDLFFYDLSGDGREEIILTGHAYGNVHHPHPYRDDRCWLFVLDHHLKPIFEPIPFSEYPSTLRAKAIETNSERHLLLVLNYRGEKNVPDFVCLMNSEGKLLPQFQGKFRADYVRSPLVSKSISEPYIFISGDGNELIKLNENLKITDRKLTYANWARVSELIDLDRDGVEELICLLDGQLSIYSQELELLAQIPPLSSWGYETYFTFRATDPQKPLDVGVGASEKNFCLYAYKKNLIYSLLPFISIGLGSVIFMILIGGYRFSWLAYTYIRYTRSSLKNAQNGVALLDGHGMIYFFNEKLEKHLRVKMNNGKRLHYTNALQERPQVIRAIQTCMETGEPVHQQVAIRDKDYQSECEIDVAPFISPLKLIRSYLVEIKESAYFTYGDRIQSWSNSVQEIAHKIKTPLSSVALNLKAFQMRLDELLIDKISPEAHEEISDDIKTMRTEIKRIENLTKSFIRFTNLEKPNFQIVNVQQMIDHAIGSFKTFTNAKLQIQTILDSQFNEIWADPQQIDKVLQILIENSIQALDGEGIIEITTSMAQYLDKSFMSFLEFEVADTGPGIAPTDHQKIFEPFYTTKKEEGTGMGLPIAKKIIEEHGGKIGLYSRSGFGAVIRFSVQLYEERTCGDQL